MACSETELSSQCPLIFNSELSTVLDLFFFAYVKTNSPYYQNVTSSEKSLLYFGYITLKLPGSAVNYYIVFLVMNFSKNHIKNQSLF